MTTVRFKHGIQDHVNIIALGVQGVVTGLMKDEDGEQYRVVYWNEGSRYVQTMFDWELEPWQSTQIGIRKC